MYGVLAPICAPVLLLSIPFLHYASFRSFPSFLLCLCPSFRHPLIRSSFCNSGCPPFILPLCFLSSPLPTCHLRHILIPLHCAFLRFLISCCHAAFLPCLLPPFCTLFLSFFFVTFLCTFSPYFFLISLLPSSLALYLPPPLVTSHYPLEKGGGGMGLNTSYT